MSQDKCVFFDEPLEDSLFVNNSKNSMLNGEYIIVGKPGSDKDGFFRYLDAPAHCLGPYAPVTRYAGLKILEQILIQKTWIFLNFRPREHSKVLQILLRVPF